MDVIRPARPGDIPAVAAIYDAILQREEFGQASTGWLRGVYPTQDTAQEALDAGELFVLTRDGTLAAAARINHIQPPAYQDAPWRFPNAPDTQVMVLHPLVVHPRHAGHGCGSTFVAFYEDFARRHGCPFLRIDTNAKNAPARALYARLGYWEAGIVPCSFNGIPGVDLVCLEKYLGT